MSLSAVRTPIRRRSSRSGLTRHSNGFLVLPVEMIKQRGLQQEAATEAILADGSRVTLESFACYVEWFGEVVRAQVIGNTGKLRLLGTELLAKKKLFIDYTAR